MITVFDVAKFFADKDESISNKKLQQLCWYAYSWYIVLENEEDDQKLTLLFDETAEAWIHGPTFPKLYIDCIKNHRKEIKSAKKIEDEYLIRFLEKIYKVYSTFTGVELESLVTHELPWKKARGTLKRDTPSKNIINNYDVFDEYLNR